VTSQAEEVEREKKLILEGKIPVEEASKELKNHPVFRISELTKEMIEGKKTKVSALRRTLGKTRTPLPWGGRGSFEPAGSSVANLLSFSSVTSISFESQYRQVEAAAAVEAKATVIQSSPGARTCFF
jgi:hypothetical protein